MTRNKKTGQAPISASLRSRLDDDRLHEHRLGFWLPKDRKIIVAWVKQLMKRVRAAPPRPLDPTLVQLQKTVDADNILKPLSDDMFTEVPTIPEYQTDAEHHRELRSFQEMLAAFNVLLTQGPQWNDIANKVGLIGCPFNAVLDWPMATASGYMFFLYPKINYCLQQVLRKWEQYLLGPDSVAVLKPPSGWLGEGLHYLLLKGNMVGLQPATNYTFPQLYKCPDPTNPLTYGYYCWEDFFTREFQDGMRPVANPNDDSVIVHACESAPFQYPVTNVQLSDNFMGKNQSYSLNDMLDQNPLAQKFAGGTVYQAFLSCLTYHWWHAPVSGTIKEYKSVAGTYYSQNLYQTFFGHWPENPDPAGPTLSQPYIASVAARGLIFIEADNPAIGLVCFIAIGMTDTSGLEFLVKPNQPVKKGEPMGKFHYGGSTHCLVFGPQVKLDWTGIPLPDSQYWSATLRSADNMPNFPVKSTLAKVVS